MWLRSIQELILLLLIGWRNGWVRYFTSQLRIHCYIFPKRPMTPVFHQFTPCHATLRMLPGLESTSNPYGMIRVKLSHVYGNILASWVYLLFLRTRCNLNTGQVVQEHSANIGEYHGNTEAEHTTKWYLGGRGIANGNSTNGINGNSNSDGVAQAAGQFIRRRWGWRVRS